MPAPHFSTPESQPRSETREDAERSAPEGRPRTLGRGGPSLSDLAAAPPPAFFESPRRFDALVPPVFFGLLVLLFVGSAALLLWGLPSGSTDELTDEELQALAGSSSALQGASGGGGFAGRPSSQALASGSAVLHVSTSPSGALVTVDGEVAGVTPLWLEEVPAQHYLVSLEKEGFGAADTLVYVRRDVPTSLSVVLPPAGPGGEEPEGEGADDEAPALAESDPEPAPPALASIRVRATPDGVPVQLGGVVVGTAPLELRDLAPGAHTLTFALPGYETETVRVDVGPGERETVEVALVPQQGTLVVVVRPWGSIYVDGVLRARDTDVSFEAPLPVGRHEIRVEHPELGTRERTVEVQPGRTTSASFDLN